jgi:hypothetical protein
MDRHEAEYHIREWIKGWYGGYGNPDKDDIEIQRLYSLALLQFKNKEEFDFDGMWRNEDLGDGGYSGPPQVVYDALEVLTDTKATEEYRKTYYSCCI